MVNEFWKYWKQRWPNASTNEASLRVSANYQETRAAFIAGYQAAEQSRALDGATPEGFCECGTSIEHHTGMGCLYRPASNANRWLDT